MINNAKLLHSNSKYLFAHLLTDKHNRTATKNCLNQWTNSGKYNEISCKSINQRCPNSNQLRFANMHTLYILLNLSPF